MTELSKQNLKIQAKRLRQTLAERGTDLSHAEALETVAHQHGYRDWNTTAATTMGANNPPPELNLTVGDRVTGHYLKRQFSGTVLAVSLLSPGDLRHTKIHFDAPVDVSESKLFSVMRQRVSAILNTQGQSCNRKGEVSTVMRLRRQA